MMIPFEKYFSPHRSDSVKEMTKAIELIKEMGVFWRGCLEDLSKADEVPYLHVGVVIKLYESMKRKELELENRDVDNEHLLALAFEQGLYGISKISSAQIREFCVTINDRSTMTSKIEGQVMELIYGFSENSPDPFPYETYMNCLPTIRNWVKLIKSAGLSHNLVIGDITDRF